MQQYIFYCSKLLKANYGHLKSDSAATTVITSVAVTFMGNSYTIHGMIPTASINNININAVISIQFSSAVNRNFMGLHALTFKRLI